MLLRLKKKQKNNDAITPKNKLLGVEIDEIVKPQKRMYDPELPTVKDTLLNAESLKRLKYTAKEKDPVFDQEKRDLQKKTTTEREQMPKNSIRFDGYKHYLNFDDPNEIRKGYRCKLCGLQTNTYCIKCKVHLCFLREKSKGGTTRKVRNCHMNFHEINEC